MASSVPKFTSFRPKPKPAPEPSKEPPRQQKAEKPRKEKDRSERIRPPSPKRQVREQHIVSNNDYFSDRRGDADVLRYGALNRYEIPPYRRYGHGFVLGLSPDQKIDREHSTDSKIYVTPATRRRQERLLTDKRANKSSERALRLVKTGDSVADLDQDFIQLSTHVKGTRDDSEDDDQETPGMDYRGIHGPKSTEPADPDLQYESDTDVRIDTEVTRQNSELVRRTRDHPEDLQGWLALIDHQEAMLKLERPSAELTASDKAHLADVRVAAYEEALKKIGKNLTSQLKLYEGLLNEARLAWDGAKLASKWKEVLAKHPQSVELWIMYLDFVQSSFTSFKYEYCRSTFFRCLDALRTNTNGVPAATTLHILLRLTSMIHEAGYQELALAIWQALLEFHLMRPGEANLQNFEEFWESEIPRIGEPEAKGWKYDSTDDASPPGPPPIQEQDPSGSVFDDFRRRETEAIAKLRYPGRTSDDAGDDDAFHTVFFSDLEPYLKVLSAETPATLILEAFLCFCGLPPLPHLATHQQEWWSDPFLQRHWHSASQRANESISFTDTLERFTNCPVKGFGMTIELLFEQDFSLDGIRLSADFIRQTLKLIASEPSSDEVIGEYLLAFELRHFPSDAFKTAKRLLKVRPSSLRLYNAYGLVESRRGNSAKADQVFSAALSMQKGDTLLTTPGSLELFRNWVWEALNRGEQTEAMWRLVILSKTSERALLGQDYASAVIVTTLLALLTYLSNSCDASLALSTHQNLTSYLTSHALSSSPVAKLHAQAIAVFLTYHATHAPIVKPALIRTTLEPLISQFPANTTLLSLYAANEARFSIDDRVRDQMRRGRGSDEEREVASWAFAIHYEMLKGEIAGSTSHSIRALYKRATTDSIASHCSALWKAYVHFELAQLAQELARRPQPNRRSRKDEAVKEKEKKNSSKEGKWETRIEDAEQRVKDAFYAGLRSLPWCKDFVMLAFTDAGRVFGEEEKARVYRVLLEKEMRVYGEVDEADA
ncbi:DUF1740-domain-containing protein [Clathrospora elynae]|uniref:DUF1740-domain-containing protein n=1 Tax=Clathrospora elynae TaxID=706981 RepID=A0A6A5T5V7_9PLEO|nr:DUF1740-domain-containing protein [Clathrospora elynae]